MSDTIDLDGIDVETCLAQLQDPAVLLADALHRVHRADAAQAEIDALAVPVTDADVNAGAALLARQDHLTRTADTLAYIANTVTAMTVAERAHAARAVGDDLDERAMQPSPPRDYEPQAVMGVKFTTKLAGHYVGRVAGREWLHVAGAGFVDVSEADEDGDRGFMLSGRVVSATVDHALCVTDGGFSITLPRALITESPDE